MQRCVQRRAEATGAQREAAAAQAAAAEATEAAAVEESAEEEDADEYLALPEAQHVMLVPGFRSEAVSSLPQLLRDHFDER